MQCNMFFVLILVHEAPAEDQSRPSPVYPLVRRLDRPHINAAGQWQQRVKTEPLGEIMWRGSNYLHRHSTQLQSPQGHWRSDARSSPSHNCLAIEILHATTQLGDIQTPAITNISLQCILYVLLKKHSRSPSSSCLFTGFIQCLCHNWKKMM